MPVIKKLRRKGTKKLWINNFTGLRCGCKFGCLSGCYALKSGRYFLLSCRFAAGGWLSSGAGCGSTGVCYVCFHHTAFNGNFSLNALFGYEWKITDWLRLTSNVRGVWTGSKRYIPIDLNASQIANQAVYLKHESYRNRYDDYLKIDLRVGVKIYQGKVTHEFAMDLQNLTNNNNILMQSYDNSRNTVKYEYQSGFYPMALYRILF